MSWPTLTALTLTVITITASAVLHVRHTRQDRRRDAELALLRDQVQTATAMTVLLAQSGLTPETPRTRPRRLPRPRQPRRDRSHLRIVPNLLVITGITGVIEWLRRYPLATGAAIAGTGAATVGLMAMLPLPEVTPARPPSPPIAAPASPQATPAAPSTPEPEEVAIRDTLEPTATTAPPLSRPPELPGGSAERAPVTPSPVAPINPPTKPGPLPEHLCLPLDLTLLDLELCVNPTS